MKHLVVMIQLRKTGLIQVIRPFFIAFIGVQASAYKENLIIVEFYIEKNQ